MCACISASVGIAVDEQLAQMTGIGPVSKVWAEGLRERGAAVDVVSLYDTVAEPLNDAQRDAEGRFPRDASPDDLVVHQGDVQAVVNALWAGGAEAMSIMNVRVLSTSAVRCVGNTLLLHGRVYSPPFRVTAIGDPAALRSALTASGGVQSFREAVVLTWLVRPCPK